MPRPEPRHPPKPGRQAAFVARYHVGGFLHDSTMNEVKVLKSWARDVGEVVDLPSPGWKTLVWNHVSAGSSKTGPMCGAKDENAV